MVWTDYLLMNCSVNTTLLYTDQIDTSSTKNCHLNCRKYFFSQRIINDWNNLPQEVNESDNVWTFKSKLDIYWQLIILCS